MIKKLLLASLVYGILGICLFAGIPDSKAVDYNGGGTYSIPNISNSTGETLVYQQNCTFNCYFSSFSSGAGVMEIGTTFGFRVTSGSTLSGLLIDATLCEVVNCGSAGDEIHTRYYFDTQNDYLKIHFDDSSYPSIDPELILTFPLIGLNDGCVGLSSDCLILVNILYTVDNGDVTMNGVGLWAYYDDNRFYQYQSYSTDTIIGGGFTLPNSYSFINNNGYSSSGGVDQWNWYQSIYSPYLADTAIVADYASFFNTSSGVYGPRSFTTTFPLYLGSSGSTIVEEELTGSGIFDACGVLSIGCYIQAIWDYVIERIFPQISFSGSFDSCGVGTSSSGSYMQKLANVFAIINPIPPEEGNVVCTLYGSGEIQYRRATGSGNFFSVYMPNVPSELEPIVNSDLSIAFGQGPIDLIVIFTCFALIFYKNKPND